MHSNDFMSYFWKDSVKEAPALCDDTITVKNKLIMEDKIENFPQISNMLLK